jgi:hypothetical protein
MKFWYALGSRVRNIMTPQYRDPRGAFTKRLLGLLAPVRDGLSNQITADRPSLLASGDDSIELTLRAGLGAADSLARYVNLPAAVEECAGSAGSSIRESAVSSSSALSLDRWELWALLLQLPAIEE